MGTFFSDTFEVEPDALDEYLQQADQSPGAGARASYGGASHTARGAGGADRRGLGAGGHIGSSTGPHARWHLPRGRPASDECPVPFPGFRHLAANAIHPADRGG